MVSGNSRWWVHLPASLRARGQVAFSAVEWRHPDRGRIRRSEIPFDSHCISNDRCLALSETQRATFTACQRIGCAPVGMTALPSPNPQTALQPPVPLVQAVQPSTSYKILFAASAPERLDSTPCAGIIPPRKSTQGGSRKRACGRSGVERDGSLTTCQEQPILGLPHENHCHAACDRTAF